MAALNRPQSSVQFVLVGALVAALASAGCGGDNPSRLAGTIEPQGRPSTTPGVKSIVKQKGQPHNPAP
jgi:hypothetical protein